MLNLSKPFGALICTIQIAVFTGAFFILRSFVPEYLALILLAILLTGVVIGATHFFEKILGFSDLERALWVSFTPTLGAAVVWGGYFALREIASKLSQLTVLPGQSLVGQYALFGMASIGPSIWTPILLQSALLLAAGVILYPLVRAERSRIAWFAFPILSGWVGAFIGWWLTT